MGNSVKKDIIKLAVPAIFGVVVGSLYSMADVFFLSKLGYTSVGGVIFPVVTFLQGIVMTYSFGTSNHISKFLGAKQEKKAKEYFTSGYIFNMLTVVILSLLIFFFAEGLVALVGTTENAAEKAVEYLKVLAIGFSFYGSFFYFMTTLRAEGNAVLAMIGAVSGLVFNIAFNLLFTRVFEFGVAGVALGTILSQAISAVLLFILSKTSKSKLKFTMPQNIKTVYLEIVKLGSSSFFRQIFLALSAIALNHVCAKIGDDLLSASTIASKIIILGYSIMLGFSQAFQVVMGYAYGEKDEKKMKEAFLFTIRNVVIVGIMYAIFITIFKSQVVLLFGNTEKSVLEFAEKILFYSSLSLAFSGVSLCINMAFQAMQKPLQNVAVSSIRQGVIYIPILLLGSIFLKANGVVFAHLISDVLAFGVILFFLPNLFKSACVS